MSNESAPTTESTKAPEQAGATESPKQPLVSYIAIVACIGIYLGLAIQNDYKSWEVLSRFGYLPPELIWSGKYWALFTSALVHFSLWHLVFNVYWLWVLGSRLERAIGSLRFLAFFVASAFVSSSFQLALSGQTGIGASGVIYSIFGFMWLTRHRYSHFNEVLSSRTIQLFGIWLVGCIVATYLKIWNVGNVAHISGLSFGCAVAGAFALRFKPRWIFAGLLALIVLATTFLFWCPWSVAWLSHKAYRAHVAKQYDAAIDRYTQILKIDPDNAWAYLNRSYVYKALGQFEKAEADTKRAREIDPSIEHAKQEKRSQSSSNTSLRGPRRSAQ